MLKQLLSFVSRRAVTLIGLSLAGTGAAQADDVIKIASIAPSGSIYHRVLQEIGEAYRKSQGPGSRAIWKILAGSPGTESNTPSGWLTAPRPDRRRSSPEALKYSGHAGRAATPQSRESMACT